MRWDARWSETDPDKLLSATKNIDIFLTSAFKQKSHRGASSEYPSIRFCGERRKIFP